MNKKIINLYLYLFYLYMCNFLFFYLFGAGSGLDPASPAWSLAQASDPAGQRHAPRVRAKVN